MRRPPILLVCLLSALTGGATGMLASTDLQIRASIPAAGSESVAVVERYYEEVNLVFAGRSENGLMKIIASGLIDHPIQASTGSDRDRLVNEIMALRSTFPELQLTVIDVSLAGNLVHATVTTNAESRLERLGVPASSFDVWSTYELFRVSQGRIVERWGSASRPVVSSLTSAPMTSDEPTWRTTSLRLISVGSAATRIESGTNPVVLHVERGLVDVDAAESNQSAIVLQRLTSSGAGATPEQLRPGGSAGAVAGDTLFAPSGTLLTLRSNEFESARLLILTNSVPVPGNGGQPPESLTDRTELNTLIAGGVATVFPAGEVEVSIGTFNIPPGGKLLFDLTNGPAVIYASAGEGEMKSERGTTWVRSPFRITTWMSTESHLVDGSGILAAQGTQLHLTSANDSFLRVTVMTVFPAAPPIDSER